MYIQYDLTTGVITGGNSIEVSNDDLLAIGKAQLFVDDSVDIARYKIDISTKELVELPPVPFVPDITTQLIAAQINAGILKYSVFHPETIAEINNQLTLANMDVIVEK